MFLSILTVTFGFTLIVSAAKLRQARRRHRARTLALQGGVAMGDNGHIDARATVAAMSGRERSGQSSFTPRQKRFLELMRICAEGPKTVAEIRFLFAEGIVPVVRPDGMVYVPCIENEHLYMEGEIDLVEEDLDRYIADRRISVRDDKPPRRGD